MFDYPGSASRQAQSSFPAALPPPPALPNDWRDPHWVGTLAYIAALTGRTDPQNAPLYFSTFDDEKLTPEDRAAGKVKTHAEIPASEFHGTFAQRLPELVSRNRAGAGVFATVNLVPVGQTRGKARFKEARAWWVDLDIDKWPEDERAAFDLDSLLASVPLAPNVVTRTKNGAHLYWLASEGVKPADCERVNKALAAALKGDRQPTDVSRVMRMPGFFHLKDPAKPFLVALHRPVLPFRHPLAEMDAAFPAPAKPAGTTAPPPPANDDGFFDGVGDDDSAELDRIKARARKYLAKVPPAVSGMGGHTATFKAAAHIARGFDLQEDDALEAMAEWNARCQPPWEEEDLRRKIREAREKGSAIQIGQYLDRRPVIVVTHDMAKVVDAAIGALKTEPELYQRGHRLVHVRRVVAEPTKGEAGREEGREKGRSVTRPADAPVVADVGLARLREMAATRGNWRKVTKKGGDGPTLPPDWVATTVMGRSFWPFRPLQGIIETPTLRPDGTVLDQPGYDPATGFLYIPDGSTVFPAIPNAPTLAQAKAALAILTDEVLPNFPFAQPHHRAAALAAILTPLVRPAIDGPCPMFLFDAPTPSSGKGLLADVVGLIATGRALAKVPETTEDEEQRKRIMSVLLAGDLVVCLDNLKEPLGNAALDALLTTTVWSDRLLGSKDKATLPATTVWVATGNNVSIVGDTQRRVIPVRLAPKEERPEERQGFKHWPLPPWVQQNRGMLVAAGLTVVRGFVAAGKPRQSIPPFGSYEAWSDLVRQSLVWAGEADCNLGRAAIQVSDPRLEAFRVVLAEWRKVFGNRPATIHDALRGSADLIAALTELDPPRPERQVEPRRLGMVFRSMKERVFGGLRLVTFGKTGKHGQPWVVEALTGPGNEPAGRA